ncbi:HAMP domain-containing sensor histidine kinase [Flavobacterium sp.]|uniref:sensor histidine kinase n=1 Tax=Flavobacterium sp. TaxID=239 RepID=UPI0026161AB7|nr:HAMP domain-containing sensor histidine kinase [Flavobacterium sp.]
MIFLIVLSIVSCLTLLFFIELKESPEEIVKKIESGQEIKNWNLNKNEIQKIAKNKAELITLTSKYENKKSSRNKAVVNLYCGLVLSNENHSKGFQYLFEAYNNKKELNNKERIVLLEALSNVEKNNFNFFSSIYYLKENLEISKQQKSIVKQFEIYKELGSCFNNVEDYKNATKNLELATNLLPILKDSLTSLEKELLFVELSKTYRKNNNIDKSLQYLDATKDQNNSTAVMLEKARVYFEKNNVKLAQKYSEKIQEKINITNHKYEEKYFIELKELEAKLNLKQRDTIEAIENLKKVIELSNKNNDYEKSLAISELALNLISDSNSNFPFIKNNIIFCYEKTVKNKFREQQYILKLESLMSSEQKIENSKKLVDLIKMTLLSILIAAISFLIKSLIMYNQSKTIEIKRVELENINHENNRINFQMALKNEQLEHYSKIIANEIKASIQSIEENSKTIENKKDTNKVSNKIIYQILNESKKLNEIIDFLLSISINSEKKNQKPSLVDFEKILNDIQSSLKNSIILLEPKFILPKEFPSFYGFNVHLFQILKNLIENSLKYSHLERTPVIKIEIFRIGDKLNIIYEDNGIGIPIEKQDKIFEKFEQSRTEDSTKGFGIGLFICREIIKNYNGTIRVESEINQGTKFIIFMKDLK